MYIVLIFLCDRLERGLSFEQAVAEIEAGRVLDILPNPSYPGQLLFIIMIDGYTCVCPAVREEEDYFLKTIYRSRKYHKRYGEKDDFPSR